MAASANIEKSELKHAEHASSQPVRSSSPRPSSTGSQDQSTPTYRLYKRRFVGIVGIMMLNVVAAMTWPWFGPIANNMVDDFGITLDQVNWLGNIVSLVYLPTAFVVPILNRRYGLRRCCDIGAACLLISAWVRYAGTTNGLSKGGAYALLLVGQLFSSIAQPIFQVLGPKYSETWFDLRGRTTATMLIAISNPVGGAIGQLLSPLVGSTRQSILILGIICSAATPFVFLIQSAPPTPPTYAGSQHAESIIALLRMLLGYHTSEDETSAMTKRERFDFLIIILLFGAVVGSSNAFSLLSNEDLAPVGYSSDTAGFMGATLLLSGILAAIITAPIFDRIFTRSLATSAKVLSPIVSITALCLTWAVKPKDTAALYAMMVILGVSGVTLMPVCLELGVELTRNAAASSAILWFSGNLFGTIFVLADGALRASGTANPPLNMHKALLFNGIIFVAASALTIFLHGRQRRREMDEKRRDESKAISGPIPVGTRDGGDEA